MKVDNYTVASIAYELKDNRTGQMIEMINPDQPQEFLFGAGLLIDGFENNLKGLESNSDFSFVIEASEAYGERDENALIEIPKDTFEVDGKIDDSVIEIGNQIPMRDNYGNKHLGIVVDHRGEQILMDFNHPLAGRELKFSGKILSVREATQQEIEGSSGCACGGSCGCGDHDHKHEHTGDETENCQVCGNPPEMQGQGIGDCKCS